MSRKNRRKKAHSHHRSATPPKLLFTFAAVRMLKEALHLVDEAFARTTKPQPNLEFGIEVLAGLKQKIDDMLQGEDWDKETPFDYNEMHILYAAVHMHLVDLTLNGNQQLMPTCLQLCKQFSRAVEALPPKGLPAPTDE